MNMDWKKHLKKIPNGITWFRMWSVIPILFCVMSSSPWFKVAGAGFFLLASITDYWDGYLARRLGAVSEWGKVFDPAADKVLVMGVLLGLLAMQQVKLVLVLAFLFRDHLVASWRALAAVRGRIIAAKASGKWKATLQMIGVFLLLLGRIGFEDIRGFRWSVFAWLGEIILWVSLFFSFYSAWEYRNLSWDRE